jgi:hypothetical protein
MSASPGIQHADALQEISWQAGELVANWRRVLDQTSGDPRPNLERASIELLRLARIDPGNKQAIVDELHNLALIAGIDDDEAQAIFARAAKAPPDTINGCAITRPSGGKNALVAFPLQAFENVRLQAERRNYLVKGLLANTGLAVIWGPPKCGKSFWAADLGMHIALGRDYRGHRVQQATVVYVALEGRHGFPARVEAFRRHHNVDNAPFYLLTASLDLVAKSSQLIAAIKAQLGEDLPGALFLDTLNRSLVGSESKDEDMARFLAAAESVALELSCAVVIVHHCGIDASRPRGHTSLSGAVESQLAVKRDSDHNIIVTVQLAKDFEEGSEITSRLERVELGIDADGDPITSCVVVPADNVKPSQQQRKVRGAKKVVLDVLQKAINEAGFPPTSNHIPPNTRTISIEQWRTFVYQATITESDKPDSQRKAFVRAVSCLLEANLIGKWGDYVWII